MEPVVAPFRFRDYSDGRENEDDMEQAWGEVRATSTGTQRQPVGSGSPNHPNSES